MKYIGWSTNAMREELRKNRKIFTEAALKCIEIGHSTVPADEVESVITILDNGIEAADNIVDLIFLLSTKLPGTVDDTSEYKRYKRDMMDAKDELLLQASINM